MNSKIEMPKFADLCQGCEKSFLGLSGSTKWCPYCGGEHEGDTVLIEFAAPVVERQPVAWAMKPRLERCAKNPKASHSVYGHSGEEGWDTPLFTAPPELADLQATIARLTAENEQLLTSYQALGAVYAGTQKGFERLTAENKRLKGEFVAVLPSNTDFHNWCDKVGYKDSRDMGLYIWHACTDKVKELNQ